MLQQTPPPSPKAPGPPGPPGSPVVPPPLCSTSCIIIIVCTTVALFFATTVAIVIMMKCMKKPWADEPREGDDTAQRAVIPELGGGAVQFSWRRLEQSRGIGW